MNHTLCTARHDTALPGRTRWFAIGLGVLILGAGNVCAADNAFWKQTAAPADLAVTAEINCWRGGGPTGNNNGICLGSPSIPTHFGETADGKRTNIRWKVPRPGFGHSSPVCVDDKIFLVCDGGWDFEAPHLVCYDADTGKELWRGTIDPVDLLPEGERAAVQAARTTFYEYHRKALKWYEPGLQAKRAKDQKRVKEIAAEAKQAGFAVSLGNGGGGVRPPLRGRKGKSAPEYVAAYQLLVEKRVFYEEGWPGWYSKVFPSPVSDGTHIYVVTTFDTLACFDLTGKRRWLVRTGKGEFKGLAQVASPILHGDLVIHRHHRVVGKGDQGAILALDKATGAVRWRCPIDVSATRDLSAPILCRVGDRTLVADSSGHLVDVTDGSLITRLADGASKDPAKRPHPSGMAASIFVDDRLLNAVSDSGGGCRKDTGTRCYELAFAGDDLQATLHYNLAGSHCGLSSRLSYRNGDQVLVYAPVGGSKAGTWESDLAGGTATGAKLQGSRSFFPLIGCDGGYLIAFRKHDADAKFAPRAVKESGFHRAVFYTIHRMPGLKVVGTGLIGQDLPDSEGAKRWTERYGIPIRRTWANPVIHRGRIYVPSMENLYCIAEDK